MCLFCFVLFCFCLVGCFRSAFLRKLTANVMQHVIMIHCLSPSNPTRHNVSFVSICVPDPGESVRVTDMMSEPSYERGIEERVTASVRSINWKPLGKLKSNWSWQWNTQWWVGGGGGEGHRRKARRKIPKSETGMTASILKKDPQTWTVQTNAVY